MTRRERRTFNRWITTTTAAVAVFGLAALALAQEAEPMPNGPAKTSAMNKKMPQDADFKMAPRWQKATDLMDKKVTNPAGENLGEIEDIVVDPNSGRILYGVVSFGGFLGMGEKFFAVPWQSLELAGDNKAFTFDVDKDRLKKAPSFDKSHWPNFADEQWATNTYKYYNQTPYWQVETNNSSADYRARWNQRATGWQKCSDLCGKRVSDARTEETGKLNDCVIDPDGGRILYGVVFFRDKYFAIPWNVFTLPSDAKQLVLSVTKSQLKDSVSFGKDNWPNMADEQWASDTFAYYKIDPYWINKDVSDQQ